MAGGASASETSRLTQRWSQRRLRLAVIASDFGLADVTGGVAQLLSVRPHRVSGFLLSRFRCGAIVGSPILDEQDFGSSFGFSSRLVERRASAEPSDL